jgi:hypothetical protein
MMALRPRAAPKWIAGAICIFSFAFNYLHIREATFSFDDSVNMQVAVSLAQSFIYKSSYLPAQIYWPAITTNGPIQYVMAGAVATFGVDTARVVVLNLIYAAFLCSVYFYMPIGAAIFALLLFIWPTYLDAAAHFIGEFSAIIFCVLGFICAEKLFTTLRPRWLWWAAALFGCAIATKFIAVFLVPFLLLVAIFGQSKTFEKRNFTLALRCYGLAISIFAGLFYLTMAHSWLAVHFNPPANSYELLGWNGLSKFVFSHFLQERGVAAQYKPTLLTVFGRPWLLVFFLSCGLTSIYRNKSVAFLWVFILALVAMSNLDERRLLPFLFFALFFGSRDFSIMLESANFANLRKAERYLAAIFVAGLLFSFLQYFSQARGTLETTWTMKYRTDPKLLLFSEYGRLPEFIKYADYPIITGGWWQMPELSLQTGTHFFDRVAPELQAPLSHFKKIYVLAKKSEEIHWPYTTRKLCGPVLFEERGYLFCELKKGLGADALGQ